MTQILFRLIVKDIAGAIISCLKKKINISLDKLLLQFMFRSINITASAKIIKNKQLPWNPYRISPS